MKKILVLISLLLLNIPSFAGTGSNLNSRVQQAVTRQVVAQQKAPSLYAVVRTHLQQYYGRCDFQDNKHKSGWYRVQHFLDWLKTNNTRLEESRFYYYHIDSTTYIPTYYNYTVAEFLTLDWHDLPDYVVQGFWSYLGVRYVEEIYHAPLDFSNLSIGGIAGKTDTGVFMGGIVFNTQEKHPLPEAINAGIHEGTHILPTLKIAKEKNMLNELATFYSEYNFSLPVKQEDAASFATGSRDVRRIHALRPDLPIYREYNLFVTGLLLTPQLTPSQLMSQPQTDFDANLSIWEMAVSLYAAQNNRFMRPIVQDETSAHYFSASKDKLAEIAQRFGFTLADVETWLASPAQIIDLGEQVWPGTSGAPESVVLQKKGEKFYFIGNFKRVGEKELLQLNFGSLANTPQLVAFYQKLFELLPASLKQTLQEKYPVVVENHYTAALAADIVVPYEQMWNRAIVQALAHVTREHLPLPKGYL